MTNYELSVRACKYAVNRLVAEGSCMFVATDVDEDGGKQRQTIAWSEVLKWLNEEQNRAEYLKTM